MAQQDTAACEQLGVCQSRKTPCSGCCSTQSTHTSGPWMHIGDGRVVLKSSLADDRLVDICDVTACDKWKANAELIAAAPDMLAALVVAREFISADRNALAEAVIFPDGHMEQDDADAVADYDKALLQINAAIQRATGSEGGAT